MQTLTNRQKIDTAEKG